MLEFLNIKISTPAGIIVLLLVMAFVGWMIFQQFYKLVTLRLETIEVKTLKKPLEENL